MVLRSSSSSVPTAPPPYAPPRKTQLSSVKVPSLVLVHGLELIMLLSKYMFCHHGSLAMKQYHNQLINVQASCELVYNQPLPSLQRGAL